MRVLFVHQNYPGQYRYLAPALAERGHEVAALGITDNPIAKHQPGVAVHRYAFQRSKELTEARGVHPLMADTQTKVIRGSAAAQAAQLLREQGFVPDLICAHPGWGESLFLKDVWPDARMLCYLEFYYRVRGSDLGFDPEFPAVDEAAKMRTRTKNIFHLMSLEAMDWGVSPTAWQRSQFPGVWRPFISAIHDGVLTDQILPKADAELHLGKLDLTLTAGEEILTFVARNLEPYRGFHSFMRALPEILAARPKARVVIVGADSVSYGGKPAGGGSWRQKMMAEVGHRMDTQRVHFTGMLTYGQLIKLFQVSRAHIYLTYPFVLSWSMLEAMSAGALVIGSRTPPVEEVIRHGENGLLVDFFDAREIAAAAIGALAKPGDHLALREAARRTVIERYDLRTRCLPAQIALAEAVGTGMRYRHD
jgi:glycosyltransferase involved in cell wall biosynthesis